jgi:hypothetical protein
MAIRTCVYARLVANDVSVAAGMLCGCLTRLSRYLAASKATAPARYLEKSGSKCIYRHCMQLQYSCSQTMRLAARLQVNYRTFCRK